MDVFPECFREIPGIPLIRLECFQKAESTDMDIVLEAKRSMFSYSKAYAARSNIHEQEIPSQAPLLFLVESSQ